MGTEIHLPDVGALKTLLYLGSGARYRSHFGLLQYMENIPCKIAADLDDSIMNTWVGHGWIPMILDMSDLNNFADNSIDAIFAIDAIEHLEKEDGLYMLSEIDRVAKMLSVIFTPVDFLDVRIYQSELINPSLDGLDLHLSGWIQSDLEDFGYTVTTFKDLHQFGDVKFDAMLGVKRYDYV